MPATNRIQSVTLQVGGRRLHADLAAPHSLAIEQRFDGTQPRWFNAPSAHSEPLALPGFTGAVASGASCNCATLHLTPHCDGTHTECVGHLTRSLVDVADIAPRQLLTALLLSVSPTAESGESSDPAPLPGDRLITRESLARAWPAAGDFAPTALVVRTLPNEASKRSRDYIRHPAPYLSREAAGWLVARGIEHLVLDVPSADRAADQGRLCAHRIFFGLPPGSTALRDALRAHCTITELAYAENALADGEYLLMLQLPALGGDALPSRPLLYPVARA
jgi:kynurenine formamidase